MECPEIASVRKCHLSKDQKEARGWPCDNLGKWHRGRENKKCKGPEVEHGPDTEKQQKSRVTGAD